jgi:hypothetical protein
MRLRIAYESVLNELARAVQLDDKRTFRNSAGVYLKAMNSQVFDPNYTAQGNAG